MIQIYTSYKMMYYGVILVLWCQFLVTITAVCYSGTTPNIRQLLIGKCLEYETVVQPEFLCKMNVNCTDIADEFMSGILYQPTCNVSTTRYNDFLNSTNHPLPIDKSIFWEDVFYAVQKYSALGKRLTSISDTLYGYLANNVQFCSQPNEPGIILNKTCAGFTSTGDCVNNAERSFWIAASQQFASNTKGKVYIMLNSSIENTFKEKSYFASWELPLIIPDKVTSAEILLVRYPGDETRSTCSDKSISKLKQILETKGISSTCINNPRSVRSVLCGDYPDHPECSFDNIVSRMSSISIQYSIFYVHIIILFNIFIMTCIYH